MPTHDDTQLLMYPVTPGDDALKVGLRRAPTLGMDSTPELLAADVEVVQTVPVKRLLRTVGVMPEGARPEVLAAAVVAPDVLMALPNFTLYVTHARLIFVSDTVEEDGSRVSGQLWFPWLQSIEFRPKQSFFNQAEFRVTVVENFVPPIPGDGLFHHTFICVFDKSFHPGQLAQTVAQRTAAFKAGQPAGTTEALEMLRSAPQLPDPQKGGYSSYDLPVYCPWPQGRLGINDGEEDAHRVVPSG